MNEATESQRTEAYPSILDRAEQFVGRAVVGALVFTPIAAGAAEVVSRIADFDQGSKSVYFIAGITYGASHYMMSRGKKI